MMLYKRNLLHGVCYEKLTEKLEVGEAIVSEWSEKYAAASAAYLTHEWKQRDFEYDLPLAPPRVKTLKTTSESEPSHSQPVSKNSENG